MPTRPSSPRRLAASWAIALAIALTACGDDNETNAGNNDPAAAADGSATQAGKPAATPEPASDEEQIRALVASVQKAFATTADGQAICDSLTERGQRDIVAYGRTTGLSGSCPAVATGMAKRDIALETEQRPTKVVAVRVRGSRATALIRIAGTTTLQQRYQKQDGQWKIGSFNLSATAGGPPPR